ncbi:MAG: DUF2283 domain-containing protein [Chloroflexi bacterium]|nr:DUF2283 domain-containing protein [Chloroflexota bacterium]
MRVSHDTHPQADILYFSTGTPDVGGSDILTAPGVVVFVGAEDGHDIVGIEIIGASAYLPLGKKGYDAKTDTLMLGEKCAKPDLITQNDDFVAYWRVDKEFPDVGFLEPVGVAIKNASAHIANMKILSRQPTAR